MKQLILIIFCLLSLQLNLFAQKHFVTSSDSISIDQQLDTHFGVDYEISDFVFVDSLENYTDYSRTVIDDEYGTLNSCIVFTAKTNNAIRNVKGVLGVYRANQIIWYSDYIIPDDEIYGGGFIDAIEDINNDGKVEIMSIWNSEGGASYRTITLFVHSWDGIGGGLAVDVSSGGSPIICHQNKMFKYIDIQGDGVFEIISYTNAIENYPTVHEWDGINYSGSTIDLETTEMFFPRNNFTPIVKSVINELDDNFIITYTAQNSNPSAQSINIFDVYGFDEYEVIYGSIDVENTDVITSDENWEGYMLSTVLTWSGYPIKPGKSVGGFSYLTNGLPVIGLARLRGYNYQWSGDYLDNHSVDDYIDNSVVVKTVAAKLPPTPFFPTEFLDTLTNYTTQSYDLGWIENEKTFNKLMGKLENAKNHLSLGNNRKTIKLLKELSKEVKKENGKKLTSEAYALLYYNTEYLITQIPPENLTIASMSPEITIEKTKDFKLTVHGTDFAKKSEVYWNGKKMKTKFISENILEADIKNKDIKKEGAYSVHVSEKKLDPTEELEFKIYKKLPEKIIPVLNCVEELDKKKLRAWFGYENYNNGIVLLDDKMKGPKHGGKFKDHPEAFLPGIHERVFSVVFDKKDKIKWEIGKEKAEVLKDSPKCE